MVTFNFSQNQSLTDGFARIKSNVPTFRSS